MTTRRTIVLFDIDSTLITIPTNREILATAAEQAAGETGLLDRMDFRGRTDRWMAAELARLTGRSAGEMFERFAAAYTPALEAALAGQSPTTNPGVTDLLDALTTRADVTIGVATGNLRRNAPIKLASGGLAGYFQPLRGGFGDEYEDRADLVRAGASECGAQPGDRVVVVGDTEHDVRAGRAIGAIAVGVATGHVTVDALASAGATVALPDFRDRQRTLRALLGADAVLDDDAARRGS